MTLPEQLNREGFHLVPKDDRLFDIFLHLTRHWGIELWEKWTEKEVELIAIKSQDPKAKPKKFKFSRQEIKEKLLSRDFQGSP